MNVLDNISPQPLFSYFEEISKIPRGSGNCEKIANWLVEFAKKHSLEYHRDSYNNVIIIKEASKAKENIAPVILQGHIDIVCEKDVNLDFDFENEGLNLVLNDDFISANGTTLGADNGIAVAIMLALLSDITLSLPRIEAVFSSDEEIGMIGASNIDVSVLKGKRMINIDGDRENEFITGCAGGNVTTCKLPVEREKEKYDNDTYQITIKGLRGGHSGIEINSGRANANCIMARLLKEFSKIADLRLVSFDGGLKDNAIPVLSVAKIVTGDDKILRSFCEEFIEQIRDEYSPSDADVNVEISRCEACEPPMTFESGSAIVDFVLLAPNGVVDMSKSIPGLVETSLNLGILKTFKTEVELSYCVRSLLNAKKNYLCEKLKLLCLLFNAQFNVEGDYPAWEYCADSELKKLFCETYEKMFSEKPNVMTIHAGLECGVFSSKIPCLDCISIGPNLYDIHTPKERVSIASVKRVWDLIVKILTEIK